MAENIHVKLPDGSVREVPRGTSALDIAKSISPRLADAALAAQVKPLNGSGGNGHPPASADVAAASGQPTAPASSHAPAADGPRLIDLARPLEEDVELRLLTDRDPEALEVYRHSSAHLMAAAVLELFPRPSWATARRPRADSSTTSIARSRSRPRTSRPSRRRCRSW